MQKMTQTLAVKKHLIKRGHITSWEAIMKYGATRLSAIIYNLRKEGWRIVTHEVTKKNRYGMSVTFADYKLAKKVK